MPTIELSQEDIIRWLREAYFAVDGVWFLTLEERLGLERAVEIDVEVWRGVAEVLAKRVKRRYGVDGSLASIVESTKVFFEVEGWGVELRPEEGLVAVERCPWYDYLNRVGRGWVIDKVCPRVCEAMFSSWARAMSLEATATIDFSPPRCRVHFTVRAGP